MTSLERMGQYCPDVQQLPNDAVRATAGTVVSVALLREEVRLWVQGKDLAWVSDLVLGQSYGCVMMVGCSRQVTLPFFLHPSCFLAKWIRVCTGVFLVLYSSLEPDDLGSCTGGPSLWVSKGILVSSWGLSIPQLWILSLAGMWLN